MIDELAPALVGPFSSFADGITLSADLKRTFQLTNFLQARALADAIDSLQSTLPGADRAAIGASWGRQYCSAFIPVALAASLFLDRRLQVDLDRVSIVLDESNGMPAEIVLPDAGMPDEAPDAFARFESLLFANVAVVFAALTACAGTSGRVLWTDLAVLLDYLLTSLTEASPHLLSRIRFDPFVLLSSRHWSDGRRNPLSNYLDLVQTSDGLRRQRKTCCLNYKLGGKARSCGDCPIVRKQQKRRALDTMIDTGSLRAGEDRSARHLTAIAGGLS